MDINLISCLTRVLESFILVLAMLFEVMRKSNQNNRDVKAFPPRVDQPWLTKMNKATGLLKESKRRCYCTSEVNASQACASSYRGVAIHFLGLPHLFDIATSITLGVTILIVCCLLSTVSSAELMERVVAIVDDDVILLSELNEALKKAEGRKSIEVLNEMINRRLLLKDAQRFIHVSGSIHYTDEEIDRIIKEYINLRIRPFIRIPVEEVEGYFREHRESFGDRNFYEVKDEIEALLTEEEVRRRLNEHLRRLKNKSYIRIQLDD
jgi:hypothetical protein